MQIKRHLLTVKIWGGKVHAFWVWATTDADGKTRVSKATYDKCLEEAGANRGECIKVG